jgi:hypothetical protein
MMLVDGILLIDVEFEEPVVYRTLEVLVSKRYQETSTATLVKT